MKEVGSGVSTRLSPSQRLADESTAGRRHPSGPSGEAVLTGSYSSAPVIDTLGNRSSPGGRTGNHGLHVGADGPC